jgi:hypothetical protein
MTKAAQVDAEADFLAEKNRRLGPTDFLAAVMGMVTHNWTPGAKSLWSLPRWGKVRLGQGDTVFATVPGLTNGILAPTLGEILQ